MLKPWRVLVAAVVVIGALAAAGSAMGDSLTPMCNNQPCGDGWYTSPVTVTWAFSSPPPANTSGCNEITPRAGNLIASTSCEATWPSGNSISQTYVVHVELTTPTATASIDTQPGSGDWYTHPVTVSFSGSSFAGIASCTAPTSYSGQAITGSCTDNAGKIASTTVSLKYDPTPPTITGATPSRAPDYHGWYTKPVSFTFDGSDLVSGIQSCQTVKYRRSASGWVTGGCWNKAGNYSSMKVWVRRLPVLGRAPARVASAPLLMRWRSVRHASYYNIQLYRGNRKLLSRWPSGSSLFLARTWRFDGRRLRLKWGRYRWYVWPGYGSRAADRYGRIVLSATFFVT